MKVVISDYEFYSNKLSKDISLVCASDFHLSHISSDKKFSLVKDHIELIEPDYILIPGDYIDMPDILEESEFYDKSLSYLESLGKSAPVFLSLGSHEFVRLDNRGAFYLNREWLKDIDSLSNVTLLHNSIFEDGELRLCGYTPNFLYYHKGRSNEDPTIFIEDYNKNMPSVTDDKYNILLCHSPIRVFDDEVVECARGFSNYDMIVSGHMHNGMLPTFVSRHMNKHIGLMAPGRKFFPNNAFGCVEREIHGKNVSLIISGGVTKIQETAPRGLHFGDRLYNPQLDYIKIKRL